MRINKKAAAVAVAAVTVAGTGVAYAYWTTTGTGAGSASVAASAGTLNLSAADITNVVPRTAGYSFNILAANSSGTDLRVASVHTVVSSGDSGCQALLTNGKAHISVADVDTSGVNVPAGTAVADAVTIGTGSLVFANSASDDQTACAGKSLTLTFNPAA